MRDLSVYLLYVYLKIIACTTRGGLEYVNYEESAGVKVNSLKTRPCQS